MSEFTPEQIEAMRENDRRFRQQDDEYMSDVQALSLGLPVDDPPKNWPPLDEIPIEELEGDDWHRDVERAYLELGKTDDHKESSEPSGESPRGRYSEEEWEEVLEVTKDLLHDADIDAGILPEETRLNKSGKAEGSEDKNQKRELSSPLSDLDIQDLKDAFEATKDLIEESDRMSARASWEDSG